MGFLKVIGTFITKYFPLWVVVFAAGILRTRSVYGYGRGAVTYLLGISHAGDGPHNEY